MAAPRLLPSRSKIKISDQWDLKPLFVNDDEWEKAFVKWSRQLARYETFRGKLASHPKALADCLKFDADLDRLGERLGTYSHLKTTEDLSDSAAQRMDGRYRHVATQSSEAASFINPEILAIPAKKMQEFIRSPLLKAWRLALERMLRYAPHTLPPREEKLMAMQGQMSQSAYQIFQQLSNADLKWGSVKDEKGNSVELGHSSYSAFLNSPKRSVRQAAFQAYYAGYDQHKNVLAATLNSSMQRDVYYARARGYPSAREASLFRDRMPVSVYDNLIEAVHRNLPSLHRYYELRKRKMKLKTIHSYDTYVPILSELEKRHTWDQAVKVVIKSLEPLGDEYVTVLQKGLTTDRWCDRYPNRGKRSGAFSSGSYDGPPYILMNFQPTVLDHVFTLSHEAGHSMHSYFSVKHQPYQYSGYTIFVAEVASTFNEELLSRHLMNQATDRRERAYLINRTLDGIRGTIFRQTMFAEFEKVSHALVEAGEPLTVETLRREYRKLLDLYFGEGFAIDEVMELECLRIPHFYTPFYVYKYATGLSAAITLAHRVMNGGANELRDYLNFLRGGGSKYPLDLLRDAGVDMEKPTAVDTALKMFGELVSELDELLK